MRRVLHRRITLILTIYNPQTQVPTSIPTFCFPHLLLFLFVYPYQIYCTAIPDASILLWTSGVFAYIADVQRCILHYTTGATYFTLSVTNKIRYTHPTVLLSVQKFLGHVCKSCSTVAQ